MIRIRKQIPLTGGPIHVIPDDILKVTVRDRQLGETFLFEEKIGREMAIDTVITLDIQDEFGMKDGIGAIFGRAQ